MTRRARQLVEGALVVLALGVVPVALAKGATVPVVAALHPLVVALVIAGSVSWISVVARLAHLVTDEMRGRHDDSADPLGWAAVRVAALALAVVPLFTSSTSTPSGAASSMPATAEVALVVQREDEGASCTVRSGDTLWTIAARELGDPGDWPRIAALNLGRVMDDGRRFSDPNVVLPGWRLALPDDTADGRVDLFDGRPATTAVVGAPETPRDDDGVLAESLGMGTVLLGLAAVVRRRRRTRAKVVLDDDDAIDVEVALLGSEPPAGPSIGAVARALAAAGHLDGRAAHIVFSDGTARLDDATWHFHAAAESRPVQGIAVVLGEARGETHVAVAPVGSSLLLAGDGARDLVADALRVASALDLGTPTMARPDQLLRALALRDDGTVVVTVPYDAFDDELRARCVVVDVAATAPLARVTHDAVALADGRTLVRSSLDGVVRGLLDATYDLPLDRAAIAEDLDAAQSAPWAGADYDDEGAVVRLLAAVPRIDGLVAAIDPGRERRATELLAYLALHKGQPVTGERLRVRVLGTADADAAAKTLFNVASTLRRALGDGPFGPRLPPAGRVGRYEVAPDVTCDISVLAQRVAWARGCDSEDEAMAWLRSALELIEGEPLATVLAGYDWFLAEGHLARLQAVCEDAACELVELALAHGLIALAALAVERATLVDPYSERLADAAARIAEVRQASLEAIAPAERSTVPSAPAVT